MDKIDFYEKNLDRVNYWLQFAEAKNAAMIAFIVAVLSIFNASFINCYLRILFYVVFLLALCLSLCSMLPKSNMNVDKVDGKYSDEDNYFYWNDIAKYSKSDYVNRINELFKSDNSSMLELMLASEIITNARIAKHKFSMFRLAGCVVIIGTILIPILFIADTYIS